MGTIRDQLQTLTGASLEASQLSQAGGQVFVSSNAVKAQADLDAVVQFWRSIHVPTYGQPIPGSASTSSGTGDGPILSTSTNQTALINALSFTNVDAVNIASVIIDIDGATLAVVDVPPTSTVPLVGLGGVAPFFIVEPQVLSVASVSGVAAGDLAFSCAYSLTVQG